MQLQDSTLGPSGAKAGPGGAACRHVLQGGTCLQVDSHMLQLQLLGAQPNVRIFSFTQPPSTLAGLQAQEKPLCDASPGVWGKPLTTVAHL